MALCAQYLDGIMALYESMHAHIGRPTLYCDNRAAVQLAGGPGEWRTQALVNRVMGVQSLINIGVLTAQCLPTGWAQTD